MSKQEKVKAVWRNLEFFLTRLRALTPCESRAFKGGFCLSTRSEAASDNWAFFPVLQEGPSPLSNKTVGDAVNFFQERGLPFVWPAKEDISPDDRALLQQAGLNEAGRLLAMARNIDSMKVEASALDKDKEALKNSKLKPVFFHPVCSNGDAVRWADTAWRGFGGEGPAPRSFRDLACAAHEEGGDALLSVTAQAGGVDAGTFLLALSEQETGVYYFAVLPEYRRQGVAAAMAREVMRQAERRGPGHLPVVLQATPAGVPFYKSAGFEPLADILLFSASRDVF